MKLKSFFGLSMILLLLIITGCSQKPPVKPSEVGNILSTSENQLRDTNGIDTTASAFDGKKSIKFRLMVHSNLSKKEATKLFNDILETIKEKSQNKDIWRYYNGQFDIKGYSNGVIYTATKKIGKQMSITNSAKSGT